MKKRYILLLFFICTIISCTPTDKKKGINVPKITYEFDEKITKHIKEKILFNIKNYSAEKRYFGIKFDICDIDNDNYVIEINYFEKGSDKYHFLSTNKFLKIEDNFELPVISSDVLFTTEIEPEPSSPTNWNRSDGTGCLETIKFKGNKILSITKCGNGI